MGYRRPWHCRLGRHRVLEVPRERRPKWGSSWRDALRRERRGTGAPVRCAPRRRRARPSERTQAPPAAEPEERGGGGRNELRQCPGPGHATLHLPSPHQGQVVVGAAFTVAVIGLAAVGAAESMAAWASGLATPQAKLRGRLGGQVMRTSGGHCRVSQSRVGVAILIQVPATCQRASLKFCTGTIQCQWWSLIPVAPYHFPQFVLPLEWTTVGRGAASRWP